MTLCSLLVSARSLAGNRTQRSVSEEVCVDQLALNMHSSHPPGTFKHTQPEKIGMVTTVTVNLDNNTNRNLLQHIKVSTTACRIRDFKCFTGCKMFLVHTGVLCVPATTPINKTRTVTVPVWDLPSGDH